MMYFTPLMYKYLHQELMRLLAWRVAVTSSENLKIINTLLADTMFRLGGLGGVW